jgi:uncharacterized protein involved in type VI secretion and phage assembly
MAGSRIYGVVVGIVTNNNDNEKLGRVKVKFPWLSGNDESDWARVALPGAGPRAGAVFIPEVKDEVLVAFEHGDISKPFVIGGLYNGKDEPPLGDGLFDQGKVKRTGFVSRKGHKFVFFEDSSKSGIALITSDRKIKISLNESNSQIHIECQGKVVIESQGDMNLETAGSLTLKGDGGVKVNSSGTVEVKGSQVKLN